MNNQPGTTRPQPKPGVLSYDPVQKAFNVDFNSIHIPGTNIDYYKASSLLPNNSMQDVMVECIKDTDNNREVHHCIRDWNAIQGQEKLSLPGLLRYYECHITKKPSGSGYDMSFITEFAHASLRSVQSSGSPLELPDLIRMMIQVSNTLYEFGKAKLFHAAVNPETILLRRLDTGAVQYKLASPVPSLNLSGKKYTQREEYLPYIAPDLNSTKSDVYALSMAFLEAAGVNMDTLMKIKSGNINTSHDGSVLGELAHVVLQAVDRNYLNRLTPTQLEIQSKNLLARISNSNFTKNDFVQKLEDIISGNIQKPTPQVQNHEEIRVDAGGNRDGPISPFDSISPIIKEDESPERKRTPFRSTLSKETVQKAFIITSLILSLLTIGLVIPILYKGYVDLKTSDQLAGAVDSIYENIYTVPFSEITVESSSCPSGYTAISSLGNWAGTAGFCYTGLVDTSVQKSDCAKYYEAQDSKNYSKWKDIVICGKPATGFSNSSTCSASQTSCYTGVCVSDAECPISQIQFSTAAETADGWTSVPYNASLFINYRRDSSALPLSTFRINIGEAKSCLSNLEYSSQQNYPAYKINGTGCTEYGSFPNSKSIDTENALLMLSEQTWSSEIVKFPEYADLLNKQTAYLTASPRIELASSCSSMNFESLKVGASGLKTIRSLTKGFGLAAIIAICLPILALLSPVITICLRVETSSNDGGCILACMVIGFFVSYPATAIILIPAAVLTRSNYNYVEPYFTEYQTITESKCFVDTQVMSTVQEFTGALTTTQSIYYLWIALAVPYWVVFVGWLYYAYLLATKRHR